MSKRTATDAGIATDQAPASKVAGPSYDYDFAVIGGGSGGMAAAKEAASLGARVVLFDFVKPSPRGTKWGLGGTCVNVGCVPKKLMHYAALCGAAMHDAAHLGWQLPTKGEAKDVNVGFEWTELKDTVQKHVRSLNFAYKTGLRSAKVEYIDGLAAFDDPHTISYQRKFKTETETLTAANVLVAVGGRPYVPDSVPGASEYAITSDDVFYLKQAPGKTLCVGAGYISLECAGFLKEIGFDVTVAVRSVVLRSFDRDCANKIEEIMEASGVKFKRGAQPTKIERNENGRLDVSFKAADGTASVEQFDTVLYAAGRYADTRGLRLEKAGITSLDDNGKFVSVDGGEATNVGHVFAVGDVLAGRDELTPVAIMAAEKLARRLFGGATEKMDYDLVPTTVFTPTEYGVIGLSEEEAIKKHGADALDVYLWQWSTLEHQAVHRLKHPSVRAPGMETFDAMPPNCMSKLVCLKAEEGRVIGFHFVGPSAGEVTQGFAIAMRCGAKKSDFDAVVGIHPTDAEALTTMTVNRRDVKEAGDWTASGGCGGGKCG